jgi:hypothetical protein
MALGMCRVTACLQWTEGRTADYLLALQDSKFCLAPYGYVLEAGDRPKGVELAFAACMSVAPTSCLI